MKASRIEFQQNLWKDLWDTWTILFMALRKLGFTMYQLAAVQKNPTIFYGNLSHHISMKPLNSLWDIWKYPFMASYTGIAQRLVEVSHINFNNIYKIVYSIHKS